ncbi:MULTISPECIES: glucose-6-phosphate dehydrogenase [unclassified Nostoc]|uniref:glucose-6-phosphate dehydrogenase n=1 Tax=unclassified Nostoc TaxID=2593658 RepID=UPI002AD4EC43|nr:glucose-6-phosphate dehydrogenase [Nostoc sp. DedQUE03]MDZ7975760.1 glucose-6-phosphate dehydrogenase [Nostoc sp. DedQUE03]MDZ8048292.1 glucose-6-phosphate dehydrogenase [Nostoc sp. DedQUE02]
MTTIVLATDIPSQINTLEKLHAWSGMALFNINSGLTVVEGVGYSERAAQYGNYWVAADSKTRAIVRASLAVDPTYLNATGKPWTFIQELSQTTLPSNFKSN